MNDVSDEAGVTAGSHPGPPPARQGRWIQAALAVLAVASAAAGVAGGVAALAETGPWGPRAALAGGWLGGGAAAAALLGAVGWIARRQERLLRRQQRILDLVSAQLFPSILEVTDAIPVDSVSAEAPPADRARAAAEISPGRVTQLLERVLTELAQIQADMLLTPDQLEARREERRRQEVQAAHEMIEQALETGQVDRAERMVDSYLRAFPDSAHAEHYRGRLADLLAEQAEEALRSGDLAAADHAMDVLARKYGGQDRADKLRDRVVGRLAEEVQRALRQDDLAGAAGMLAEFDRRFPDDSRAKGLHARLAAARQAVQADEARSHRERIEELMALARFDQAEVEAGELAARHPELAEAKHLLETVQREAAAFRAERRSRLYAQIKRFADAKQWRNALDSAQRLVAAHPECPEAKEADAMMATLRQNAKIEQVREMRDQLTDMVRRRRFAEALEIARDVIDQFPDSQAAIELRSQLPRLVELAVLGEGHPR